MQPNCNVTVNVWTQVNYFYILGFVQGGVYTKLGYTEI